MSTQIRSAHTRPDWVSIAAIAVSVLSITVVVLRDHAPHLLPLSVAAFGLGAAALAFGLALLFSLWAKTPNTPTA